jgi:2-O-methyltransferase
MAAANREVKMDAIHYLKNKLPPSVSIPLRKIINRARGLPTSLTHGEIATLINKPEPTVLEIGCNNGDDTLSLLKAMPRAKLYCFEPDLRAARRFKERLGSDLHKVVLTEIAVSDRTGTIDFHPSSGGDLPEGWDQSGSTRRPKNHLIEYPWVKFDKTITVNSCRLDDWCFSNGVKDVDFIWMDVQGAEGDVITGAPDILRRTRFLYTEYSDTETYEGQPSLTRLLAMLPSFKIVARYPGDVLLKNSELNNG